jgi:hypothetical protein
MSAEGVDSKRAAVIDRRYSAIFSHLLRHYKEAKLEGGVTLRSDVSPRKHFLRPLRKQD